ncbi:fungal-specific transcription factor domain-containing protein [Xylaria venustula]|nr:fungal-specific transcription factor domain-containing protein [Xylaria venustula]
MAENESAGNRQSCSPTRPPMLPKRLLASSEHANPRSKRTKYNRHACDSCKKRKLRCDRDGGGRDCGRCINSGRPCVYAKSPSFRSSQTSQPPRPLSHTVPTGRYRSEEQSSADVSVAGDDSVSLREQIKSLGIQLKGLSQKLDLLTSTSQPPANSNQASRHDYLSKESFRQHEPQQPLFVGHTRSAFSLDVAKTSLSQMGICPDAIDAPSGLPSLPPSPRDPPEPDPSRDPVAVPLSSAKDPLLNMQLPEVYRLISVYQEEIEALYPFVTNDELVAVANTKLKDFSMQIESLDSAKSDVSEDKDINILKIAVAIAVVIETKGKNPLSSSLIDSTNKKAAQITRSSDVDLRDLQWLALMATYFFQIDEDLVAWRTIGNAARMTLEMGLHRRRSVMDNYKSADHQEKATRVFWCVYALDRRWSFGIGLPFALNDRDIDPELPEPGDDFAHIRCLIGWGRLSGKVWEALPPYGSPTTTIPLDQVQYLEFLIQNWQGSIPPYLQFNHPRLGLALRNQPRTLRRLCTLLYLRGNHLRTLVHRHHVLSPSLVHADLRSSRLIVDIAKDSIQVLVDLAETSDIYTRQQATFNYFLLSALAVMLLAVCNAPKIFFGSCQESFSSAIELVRNFSRSCLASRRLWNSIRGLLPAMKALGLKIGLEASNRRDDDCYISVYRQNQDASQVSLAEKDVLPQAMSFTLSSDDFSSVPNTLQMGDDLMGLFNAFGQADANMNMFDETLLDADSNYMPATFPMEISRHFQGLI